MFPFFCHLNLHTLGIPDFLLEPWVMALPWRPTLSLGTFGFFGRCWSSLEEVGGKGECILPWQHEAPCASPDCPFVEKLPFAGTFSSLTVASCAPGPSLSGLPIPFTTTGCTEAPTCSCPCHSLPRCTYSYFIVSPKGPDLLSPSLAVQPHLISPPMQPTLLRPSPSYTPC